MEGLFNFVAGLTTAKLISYFWPFFLLDMVRYVFIEGILIAVHKVNRWRNKKPFRLARHQMFQEKPLVSVIVPGKNEGKHIPALVRSLSQQTYINYELVVIDDGSDDNTRIICQQLRKEGKIDVFIRNDIRGGKASAANTALCYAKGDYILHLDADSHLEKDAIEQILLPFYLDEQVGAVGGDVRVANESESLTTQAQAIEYYKTISSGRTASSELGILRIISGAHGMFRRDALDQIGGWDVGPGLDGDITLKIRKLGYKVVHQVDAVCYTNVPASLTKLAKQRYRWDKSMIRFRLRKHVDVLTKNENFRLSTFFSVLENLLFNLFFDIKWIIYFVYILFNAPQFMGYIFIFNYLLYFLGNCIQFFLVSVVVKQSNHRGGLLSLVIYLPLMPLYTGIYLRIIRTYAYLMELIHKTSYDDAWNPWKVSNVAKREKL